ncbi:MAG TPA: hypothetical protein VJX23_06110 [Candidatus Binataceae bacterium]|nr:hypothetical protein [Candidatus Binataceae bacterium]
MPRPTLKELMTGLQGTVVQTLLPELTSPYAQGQAMSLALMMVHAVDSIEKEPAYDAAEIKDLRTTIAMLRRLEKSHLKRGCGDLKKMLVSGAKAAARHDQREMEATVSAFVTALALGRLDDIAAKRVRAWVHRHLERQKAFLGSSIPG